MNKILFFTLFFISFASCQKKNSADSKVRDKQIKDSENATNSESLDVIHNFPITTTTSKATTIKKNPNENIDSDISSPLEIIHDHTPISETPFYPNRDFEEKTTTYDAEILITGILHGEEVSQNTKNKKWYGLFKSKNEQFELRQTKLFFTTVFDQIVDEREDFPTGVKVETASKDSVILLVSNLDYLENRLVESINNPPNQILPNESFEFYFKGKAYKLSAFGDIETDPFSKQEYVSGDYELFLEYTENGKTSRNLVSAALYFDESMIEIIFIGDIDGDDKIDLILDNSPKYNAYTPTLYLSSVARRGQMLKIVGRGSFVGC